MTEFRYLPGAVYILENLFAQRVKIGMTINDVALRLRDVNDMWLEYKLTCQICGSRQLTKIIGLGSRLLPRHVISGGICPGSNELPLEADLTLAQAYLGNLKLQVTQLSGSDKASVTRRINALEQRIMLRSQHCRAIGMWRISTVFYTDRAEQVELHSHEILKERLDTVAPLGEVFCCTASEAIAVVERALTQLGVMHFVKREGPELTGDRVTPIERREN